MERKHRQKRAAERTGAPALGASTRRTRGASSSRTAAAAAYLAGSSSGDGSSPSGASPSTSGGAGAHHSQHSGGHSGLSAGHTATAHTPVQPAEPQMFMGVPPAYAPAHALVGEAAAAAGLSDKVAAAQFQQNELLRQQQQQQAQLVAEAQARVAMNGWAPSAPSLAPAGSLPLGAGVGAAPQRFGSLHRAVPTNTHPGAWPGPAAPQQGPVPSLTPDEIDQLLVSRQGKHVARCMSVAWRVHVDCMAGACRLHGGCMAGACGCMGGAWRVHGGRARARAHQPLALLTVVTIGTNQLCDKPGQTLIMHARCPCVHHLVSR